MNTSLDRFTATFYHREPVLCPQIFAVIPNIYNIHEWLAFFMQSSILGLPVPSYMGMVVVVVWMVVDGNTLG